MATAGHSGRGPGLYQVLGVARDASAGQVAAAWRRRARAEHPDARPADAGAAARFRALAEAYRVLGDPVRRAAYDRALAREQQPAARVRIPVRHVAAAAGGLTPPRVAGAPPLRAGPVRVDGSPPAAAVPGQLEDAGQLRLAVLAEVARRLLAAGRGRPW
jgi:curved DNA-binding protein CbpA